MSVWKKAGLVIVALILLGIAGCLIWVADSYEATERALTNMESGNGVDVMVDEMIRFVPEESKEDIGIIFYPGGKVEPESYATLLRPIAEAGYEVVLVPMPANLAIFNIDGANSIISERREKQWVIIGHSLGGSMAASYVKEHPEQYENGLKGLLFWASYTVESADLSDMELPVGSIYGTLDMGIEGIETNKVYNPDSTVYYVIEGGNHAQFGDYGPQKGDNEALITDEEQYEEIIGHTLDFLEQLN